MILTLMNLILLAIIALYVSSVPRYLASGDVDRLFAGALIAGLCAALLVWQWRGRKASRWH